MVLGSDRLALMPTEVTASATEFQLTCELANSLKSGSNETLHGRSWDGTVLVCLEVDGDDRAIVEVQCASGPGYDDLATVEQAIAHLEAVRYHLLARQGVTLRTAQSATDLVC